MSPKVNEEQLDTEISPHAPKLPVNPKADAIFGKDGMLPRQVTHEKNVGDVRTNINALKGLQDMSPTTERTKQIVDLERQRGRIGRFAYLQTRGTPEQKKILEKKDTLEALKASDLLLLKKKGADLANLLLVADTNPTGSVMRDNIKEGDKFIVNFGEGKKINDVIGAGDILPASVNRITVNGVEGVRKNAPRPGFYDARGKYLPIYDGYKIEVAKMGKMEEKEMKELSESEDKWFKERRIDDMIDNGGKALSDLPEDMELEKEAQEETKRRKDLWIDNSPEDTVDNGENLKWEALWNDEKFQNKLTQICANLKVTKEHMKTVMQAESGLNPKIVNRTSHATGLIQFMPKTALGLGTTVWALRKMTSVDQLDYVEKYFKPYAWRLNSTRDLYMVTFYPVALGKSEDFILGSESWAKASPEMIASQNKIVAPGKSVITVADFNDYVARKEVA